MEGGEDQQMKKAFYMKSCAEMDELEDNVEGRLESVVTFSGGLLEEKMREAAS